MVCYELEEDKFSEAIHLLPNRYISEYILDDSIVLYGMYIDNDLCGLSVLRKENPVVKICYININDNILTYNIYSDFINEIAYDMYIEGFEKLEWDFVEDDNKELIEIFKSNDFKIIKDDIAMFDFKIKDVKLMDIAIKRVISLKETENVLLKNLTNAIINNGDDIIKMPIKKDEYDEECSAVYVKNDLPEGILLLQKDESGKLIIPYMYSHSSDSKAILEMIGFLFEKAKEKYEENTDCEMYIVESVLVKIIERITGLQGKYKHKAIMNLLDFDRYEF